MEAADGADGAGGGSGAPASPPVTFGTFETLKQSGFIFWFPLILNNLSCCADDHLKWILDLLPLYTGELSILIINLIHYTVKKFSFFFNGKHQPLKVP